ncbi:MAG: hypothetical protein WCO07_01215 [bacterium]
MENENNTKNKNAETYTGDMIKAVDGSEGIYMRKVIEEQEEHEAEIQELSPESQRNKYFMFIGVFLLACSLGALIFLAVFKKEIFTVSVQPEFVPMIYLDEMGFKEIGGLTKDQISQSVSNEVLLTEIKQGGVLGTYFTVDKKIIGLRKFLSLIFANIDQKRMNFVDDNFLIGVTNTENKNLFMLWKIRSMTDVFDVMRSWEEKMFYDLHGFFGINITPDTKYLLTKNFEDGIIQNKNARILRDNDGNIVMMYVFSSDTSLIVTNSELSVHEIMLRLSSSMIKK